MFVFSLSFSFFILWLCLFFQAQDNFQIYYIVIFKITFSVWILMSFLNEWFLFNFVNFNFKHFKKCLTCLLFAYYINMISRGHPNFVKRFILDYTIYSPRSTSCVKIKNKRNCSFHYFESLPHWHHICIRLSSFRELVLIKRPHLLLPHVSSLLP